MRRGLLTDGSVGLIVVVFMHGRERDPRPKARPLQAQIRHEEMDPDAVQALIGGRTDMLTPNSLLSLQKTAGNASIAATLVQRAPAATKSKGAKVDEWADMVAAHIDEVLTSGGAYGPADAVGLPDIYVTFVTHLSQLLYQSRFGSPKELLKEPQREAELVPVNAMMPGITLELYQAHDGAAVLGRLQARISHVSSVATHNALIARAQEDADLGAALLSRPVAEARKTAFEVLKKNKEVVGKFSDEVERAFAMADHEKANAALGLVHKGIDVGFGVVEALKPDTYRKAVEEAREWCGEHGAGALMGSIRAAALSSEIIELTVGTVAKATGVLSKIAIWVCTPTGATLEALEELSKAGNLVSSSGSLAVKLGKVAEYAETLGTIVDGVNVVGGVAKFITADSTGERVDAGIKATTGAGALYAQVAKKAAEKAAKKALEAGVEAGGEVAGIGTAATVGAVAGGVAATWEMYKFFGEMGNDAIEGSLYGGLYQELREIEPKVDDVAKAILITERAMDERDKRFGNLDVADPRRAPADDAVEDLAYQVQKKLRIAAQRWQNTSIPALRRSLEFGATSSNENLLSAVASVLAMDYHDWQPGGAEPGLILGTANDFVNDLRGEWKDAPYTVLEMAVDQHLMSKERAAQMSEKLTKEAQKKAKEAKE